MIQLVEDGTVFEYVDLDLGCPGSQARYGHGAISIRHGQPLASRHSPVLGVQVEASFMPSFF